MLASHSAQESQGSLASSPPAPPNEPSGNGSGAGDDFTKHLAYLCVGGYYDHQKLRTTHMNRVRDLIRKVNEGIPFDKVHMQNNLEVELKALKALLMSDKPMTPYQIEKRAGIPHATFAEHIKRMLDWQLIRVVEERTARSGLKAKLLEPTTLGLLLYLREKHPGGNSSALKTEYFDQQKPIPGLYPKDDVWQNIESILGKHPDPWLYKRLQLCEKVNAPELFRAFLLVATDALPERFEYLKLLTVKPGKLPVKDHIEDFIISLLAFILMGRGVIPTAAVQLLADYLGERGRTKGFNAAVNAILFSNAWEIIEAQTRAYLHADRTMFKGILESIKVKYYEIDMMRSGLNQVEKELMRLTP